MRLVKFSMRTECRHQKAIRWGFAVLLTNKKGGPAGWVTAHNGPRNKKGKSFYSGANPRSWFSWKTVLECARVWCVLPRISLLISSPFGSDWPVNKLWMRRTGRRRGNVPTCPTVPADPGRPSAVKIWVMSIGKKINTFENLMKCCTAGGGSKGGNHHNRPIPCDIFASETHFCCSHTWRPIFLWREIQEN